MERFMKKILGFSCIFMLLVLAGCGNSPAGEATTQEKPSEKYTAVADKSDMIKVDEVEDDTMVPVKADKLKEGTYPIKVATSSTMFPVTACDLTVKDGKMSAVMTMSGTGYLFVYMGTGKEAASVSEKHYIPFEEAADGTHTFTVPVEALDQGIPCAAFSKKKEKWYNRSILFRSDSLPNEAFADGVLQTVESLGLSDGEYTCDVELGGGSGKATVNSPAQLKVSDKKVTARIEWSSPNYDYMIVNEEKFLPLNQDGNSIFEIPVRAFDIRIPVIGDTTAMSQPHEIEYTLKFDSSSLKEK